MLVQKILPNGRAIIVDEGGVLAPNAQQGGALPPQAATNDAQRSGNGLGALIALASALGNKGGTGSATTSPGALPANTNAPQSAPSSALPTGPTNSAGAISGLGGLLQGDDQTNAIQEAMGRNTTGNDFVDRANDVPVLGNIVSGLRGILGAASQRGNGPVNVLAQGLYSGLYPNDMAAENQRQNDLNALIYGQKRYDLNREFGRGALKDIGDLSNTADKNTNDATQNANTAWYNQGRLKIDQGNLDVNRGELGVHRTQAANTASNQSAEQQAKADEGFNTSLQRYQSVGKVFDKFGNLTEDTQQKQLPFDEVLERSAYDNPNSTQAKNWAYTQLRRMQNGLHDYVRGAKTPQEAEKRKNDYVSRMNAKATELRTKFNLTGK